jgi:hypothetical protein
MSSTSNLSGSSTSNLSGSSTSNLSGSSTSNPNGGIEYQSSALPLKLENKIFTGKYKLSSHHAVFIMMDGTQFPSSTATYQIFYIRKGTLQRVEKSTAPPEAEYGFTDEARLQTFVSHCIAFPVANGGASWARDAILAAGTNAMTLTLNRNRFTG